MSSRNPEWQQIVDLTGDLLRSISKFTRVTNKLDVIRENLRGENKIAALWVAEYLSEEDKIAVFPSLLELALSDPACAKKSQDIILGISPQWLIDNIEEVSKPILDIGYDFEYWQLLSLCSKVSSSLTHHIASIAAKSEDKNIKEAGEYFIDF